MSKPNGWLNDWEAEAEERRVVVIENVTGTGAVRPITRPPDDFPDMPDPALFVDDFGGSHCFECSTVYRPEDDGDTCPTCGAGAS